MKKKSRQQLDRSALLAEIGRIRKQELSPTEALLQRYLSCKDQQTPSLVLKNCIGAQTSKRPMHTPAALLPWLG